jgi:hypothetical protein
MWRDSLRRIRRWAKASTWSFEKNEPILGRFVGNPFVFMEFEEGGSVFEVAALALGALGLDFAELVQGFLELAGESLAVQAEGGQHRD